jgi:hypothetical protein
MEDHAADPVSQGGRVFCSQKAASDRDFAGQGGKGHLSGMVLRVPGHHGPSFVHDPDQAGRGKKRPGSTGSQRRTG